MDTLEVKIFTITEDEDNELKIIISIGNDPEAYNFLCKTAEENLYKGTDIRIRKLNNEIITKALKDYEFRFNEEFKSNILSITRHTPKEYEDDLLDYVSDDEIEIEEGEGYYNEVLYIKGNKKIYL